MSIPIKTGPQRPSTPQRPTTPSTSDELSLRRTALYWSRQWAKRALWETLDWGVDSVPDLTPERQALVEALLKDAGLSEHEWHWDDGHELAAGQRSWLLLRYLAPARLAQVERHFTLKNLRNPWTHHYSGPRDVAVDYARRLQAAGLSCAVSEMPGGRMLLQLSAPGLLGQPGRRLSSAQRQDLADVIQTLQLTAQAKAS